MLREDLRIRLRRRTPWEAFELGRTMVRAWRQSTYRAWAAVYGSATGLILIAAWPWPELAPWLLWWLKPLFDRVLLFVFSQRVFGRTPTVTDVVRELPTILRRSGLLAGLTVYRLSPARSLYLPVWQLEGQRGSAARRRASLIGRRASIYAVWLTAVCSSMSGAIVVSLVLLFEWLLPSGLDGLFSWDAWLNDGLSRLALFLLAMFTIVAESIVEPFYVASGFSLYLNRRSELEAWDVEVGFRALAARHAAPASAPRAGRGVAAAVALAMLFTAVPAIAQAPTSPPPTPPPRQAADRPTDPAPGVVIREVLRDPVFGTQRESIAWRPKSQNAQGSELPAWLVTLGVWLATFARVIRYALWPIAAGLVAWLVIAVVRRGGAAVGRHDAPAVLFGHDVRPQSLPPDIPSHARSLIQAGDITAALALLYRGALSALVHRHGVTFSSGDAEGDCARRARPVLAATGASYFDGLIGSWQAAAYGRVPPPVEVALALCDGWSRHFGHQEAA